VCGYRSRGPPFSRGLDRRAIDNPGAGLAVFACGLTDIAAYEVMHEVPGAVLAPGANIVIDRRPGREVMGEQAPGAAPAHDIEDTIEDFSLGVLRRSASRLDLGDIRCDQRPFVIGEIGRVRLAESHAPQFTLSFFPGETFFNTLLGKYSLGKKPS
jgi:hypothetical protein